ncbi:MAG: polyhydroxyalkanoic acid system family protein [Deltaproteobacteria bacterium]|nr:polyhydroxyalkanoic acid system family protein [Deltaproteobacteria bacterium]
MKHSVPHDLQLDLARRVARRALAGYLERFARYQPRLTWQGEDRAEIAFSALGASVQGVVELGAEAIDIDLAVPLLLSPFRARAIEVVEREIRSWIERARRGELDASDDTESI